MSVILMKVSVKKYHVLILVANVLQILIMMDKIAKLIQIAFGIL